MYKSGEQRIRVVLYYLSVAMFFIGLPFILAFSLSYKFNPKKLQFTKTGIISIKTQPAGAFVYIDGKLLADKTPVSINELLPAKYKLEAKLDGYYPYSIDVEVEAGKVIKIEKVILFSLIPNIEQLNKDRVSFFWVDEVKGLIYYVNESDNIIYRSDQNGEHFEEVAKFIPISPIPKKWVLSYDKEKLIYFNNHQIGIVNFNYKDKKNTPGSFIINYPEENINDVFWYSDNYHLILICNNKIAVSESRVEAPVITLVNLNKKNSSGYFDVRADILYFLDSQRAADGQFYDNLYKIQLNKKIHSFQLQEFIN